MILPAWQSLFRTGARNIAANDALRHQIPGAEFASDGELEKREVA